MHARQWHFRCATEAEREKWVHAFLAATLIAHGDQVYNMNSTSRALQGEGGTSGGGGRRRKRRSARDDDSEDEYEELNGAINK